MSKNLHLKYKKCKFAKKIFIFIFIQLSQAEVRVKLLVELSKHKFKILSV